MFPPLKQVMLPHCEKLPPIGSKGSETCFRIGIPHMEPIFEGNLYPVTLKPRKEKRKPRSVH